MKKLINILILYLFISSGVWANTLEKKKKELEKIYEAGGISKTEYKKAVHFLENPEERTKKKSQSTFSLGKSNKNSQKKILQKYKDKIDKDKEEITLKKVEELGQPIKFDNTYFTDGMIKEFGSGCKTFHCRGGKAGQFLAKTFKRSKAYGQKNPGKMIKAMAMFEVMYAQKLWEYRKPIERFKENNYKKGLLSMKRKDEKQIRTLLGMNKGRKGMRTALGMTLETPAKDAMKSFWSLGAFLDLGTGVNNEKLAKDLKEREKLLEAYKAEISKLRKKLQSDLDDEGENEKSVQ